MVNNTFLVTAKDNKQVQDLVNIQAIIETELYKNNLYVPVTIAGGCCVDILYRFKEPKDIDIFLSINNKSDNIIACIMLLLCKKFDCKINISSDYSADGSDFTDRIQTLLKCYINGYPVDILLHKSSDTKSLLDTFDCNMNLVYLDYLNKSISGTFPVDNLVFLKDITSSRHTRMMHKFNSINLKLKGII